MAGDFKQMVDLRLSRTFKWFLSLTLTQQSIIVIAGLFAIALIYKPLLSLFWLYSFVLVGFFLAYTKWDNCVTDFRPVSAKSHLAVIDVIKDAKDKLVRFFIYDWSQSTETKADEAHLKLEIELNLFLEFFSADFIDAWFAEIASDRKLKEKMVDILQLIANDVIVRVSNLDVDATIVKILRAYEAFLFQSNEAKKSLRTKSLFDSNRRLKRVHCVEEAFEINFGLHPVVRSLISLGGMVSDKSLLKKLRRKSSSTSSSSKRSFSTSSISEVPVKQFDYFYSLIGLLVELQFKGGTVHVSRVARDALADIVSAGILPLLPKLIDPAFLYECVSDLLAPPCLENYRALLEAEKKWLMEKFPSGHEGDDDGGMGGRDSIDASSALGGDAGLLSSTTFDSIDELDFVGIRELNIGETEDDPRKESMEQLSLETSDEVFVSVPAVANPQCNEPLEPLPIDGLNMMPKFIFTQFEDFIDVSLSTSALTVFQEEALNAVFDDDDDEDTVEPRVEVTAPDNVEDSLVDDDASTTLRDTRFFLAMEDGGILTDTPPATPREDEAGLCDSHSKNVANSASWSSCPNLLDVDETDASTEGMKSRTNTKISGYDCFSVGELPIGDTPHFQPHLFSPAPDEKEDLASSYSTSTTSEGDLRSSVEASLMDRLFLSVMIPETVLLRDPHSGIKFTLYVIHFSAVYPCGPGGTLEPRVGVVKRRFREFLTLHERLENSNSFKYSMKDVKGPSKWSGPFPWTNFDKDLIETRRKSLEVYLKSLVALTDISCSQPLREFLAYDSDPRIAYVQKAPMFYDMFRLDKFFNKGLKGSIDSVLSSQPAAKPIFNKPTQPSMPSGKNEGSSVVRSDLTDYHPTATRDLFMKSGSPLLRGKDLSGAPSVNATPHSTSPNPDEEKSHLANNLTLVASLLYDDEELLRKGVLDIQFSAANQNCIDGISHVPSGPHFRWGPRGKKEQVRYNNYCQLKPRMATYGRNLEKQCEHHLLRKRKKTEIKEDDLNDLLGLPHSFPKIEANDDVFYDANAEFVNGEDSLSDQARETSLLDATIDVLFEAMRFHPGWVNHELLLKKFKLVFGALTDYVIGLEIRDVTTKSRWAYYLGLLRITLWSEEEDLTKIRDVEEARRKAFHDLITFLPKQIVDVLGSSEVHSAINIILDSVSNYNFNLHFILTIAELLLQELYPEIDFLERLKMKIENAKHRQ